MMISGSSPSFCLRPLSRVLEELAPPLTSFELLSEGMHDLAENRREVLDVLSSHDLHLTVHAPFSDVNLSSVVRPMREASVRRVCAVMEGAAAAGASVVTVHPGYTSPMAGYDPSRTLPALRNSLEVIAARARDTGLTVGLENMPRQKGLLGVKQGETAAMLEGSGLGLTLDVGHAFTAGQLDGFRRMKARIVNVHIHDNDSTGDQHLPLGRGKAPLEDIVRWLGSTVDGPPYDGTLVIEARNAPELLESYRVASGWVASGDP